MSVEFLADDKASAYGSFPPTVSRAQLAEYFHLAADTDVLGSRRGDHNRLGFALQLLHLNPARCCNDPLRPRSI